MKEGTYVLHDTLDVALLLGKIEVAELHRTDASPGVTLENRALTLTATTDDLTHLGEKRDIVFVWVTG